MTGDFQLDYLINIDLDIVPYYTFEGLEMWARIPSHYDGDSTNVIFLVNGIPYKFKARLNGIDCAEKRSANPLEYQHAQKAIEYFDTFILSAPNSWAPERFAPPKTAQESSIGLLGVKGIETRLVYIKCGKWDKYGRLLIEIYSDQEKTRCLNKELVEQGLAYEYSGGKKKKFEEWVESQSP